jgi:hypothetical protein
MKAIPVASTKEGCFAILLTSTPFPWHKMLF